MSNNGKSKNSGQEQDPWQKTPVANLLRYAPSRTYFARVRVGGKLFRASLKTEVFSVATLRLAVFIKEKRSEFVVESRVDAGKMTFGDALEVFRQRMVCKIEYLKSKPAFAFN